MLYVFLLLSIRFSHVSLLIPCIIPKSYNLRNSCMRTNITELIPGVIVPISREIWAPKKVCMYLVHYNSKKQGFLTWQRVLHTNFKITSSGFLVLMFFPFGCQPDFLKSLYYCTVHRPKTGFNSKCFFPHSGSAVLTKRLVSFCLLYNRCYVVLYPVPGICLRIYVLLCCLCLLFILIYGGFR